MTARNPFFYLGVLLAVCVCASTDSVETIGYHKVRTDAQGQLLPWYGNSEGETYDFVLRQLWSFWSNMKPCPNGVPYYLQHQVWKPNEADQRGLGGDQINMALSSWNLLYGYLGDPAIKANMTMMADYWLDHGFSSAKSLWPNLPFPYNTELHSGMYDGDMRAGKGFLQPDKGANFGAELVMLYKMTGNPRYLKAALQIADTLTDKIQAGDGEHSPWPFRVNAEDGTVHSEKDKDGKWWVAEYTTDWTDALRLFRELSDLHAANSVRYERSYAAVVNWVKTYPLKTNKWGPFFEDIPTSAYSDTETNADTMAAYILEHPDWDRQWRGQAQGILDWSYKTFANHEFAKCGVIAIMEQTVYLVPGNSHTSRHASVELLNCEKTGDCKTKDAAIRRLTWATYWVDYDGKNKYPRDDNWLTDGYGDYVRHFLRAMASAPELAPAKQNHLLRSTSVVQNIEYRSDRIHYTKYDAKSSERFKLGATTPEAVKGGKMYWEPRTRVLNVDASEREVSIELQ